MLWLKVISPEILGGIFETAIFSELVKNFGKESVNFWRTKDKKEIDFILKVKNKIIPLEVKVNFSSVYKRSIGYFLEKYKLKEFYFIGLRGEKKKGAGFIFPWEITRKIKDSWRSTYLTNTKNRIK